MSIYDALKEVTDEENKIEGRDVAADEKEPTHAETRENPGEKEEPEEKPAEAAAKPEKNVEEPAKKDEAKPAEGAEVAAADANPTAADFAKLRYEATQAKRRAEAAEAQLKSAPTQTQPGPAQVKRTETEKRVLAEPDANLDPEAHLRWQLQQTQAQLKEVSDWKQKKDYEEHRVNLRDNAIKSYSNYEQEFIPTVPDYKEATTYGLQTIKASLQTLNPSLQGEALMDAVKHKVLELGAQAEARGEQPAEFFYKQSKAWGYKQAAPAAVVTPAEQKTPSIKKIGEHKARSASSLTPGGKAGAAPLSAESVKGMGFQDFLKLTPSQLREMESLEA